MQLIINTWKQSEDFKISTRESLKNESKSLLMQTKVILWPRLRDHKNIKWFRISNAFYGIKLLFNGLQPAAMVEFVSFFFVFGASQWGEFYALRFRESIGMVPLIRWVFVFVDDLPVHDERTMRLDVWNGGENYRRR